jgi:hypothetical protein
MSRRKRRATESAPEGADAQGRGTGPAPAGHAARPPARRRGLGRRVAADIGILIAVFAITVAVAELAGAANLGVAFGIGQIAFALALVALLLRA